MSTTCQITLQARDTLRLDVPGLATQPHTCQMFMQILLAIPEVTGVEVQPVNESIIVRHAGAEASRTAILQALRSGSAPAAPAAPTKPSAEPAQAAASPYAYSEVVHAMRGRVRLHIPGAGSDAALAGVLAMFLCEQPGIRNVRLNHRVANVIISFDPSILDAQAVTAMVAAYMPDATAVGRWQATQHAYTVAPIAHGRRRKIEAGLAAVALAVTLFAGASAAWLVYALLIGAAGSIIQRTYKSLRTTHRKLLTVDAAAAAAMVVAGVFGALWIAALIPLALFGAPLVNSWAQANATRTKPTSGAKARPRTVQKAAVRAVAALPQSSSPFRFTPTQPAQREPEPALLRETPTPAPARVRTTVVVESAQTFTGVSGASSTAASISSTTWFVHSDSQRVAQKAYE